MEIMENHEAYVSLEVAKLLKQAGFDWECSSLYTSDGEFKHLLHNTINWDYGEVDWNNVTCKKTSYMGIKGWEGGYSAPTLDVAQRYLRMIYHLHITIFSSSQESWMFRITKPHQMLEDGVYGEDFYTYEEAQEAGIKEALEIILEKGE